MKVVLSVFLAFVAVAVKGEYLGAPPTVAEVLSSEDFITASLLTIDPGVTMYSLVGHSALRMRTCGGRDICFSYESEVSQRVLGYLVGRLKMGMFAVPTPVYLEVYRKSGRAVRENVLNLSPEARLRLWRVLDRRAREGINLPCDYMKRGCAKTVFEIVCGAAGDDLRLPDFPTKYDRTLREMVTDAIPDLPWSLVLMSGLAGTDADADLPPHEKVILPRDLLEIFSSATYRGKPLLGSEAILLDVSSLPPVRTVGSLHVAWAFLVLVCLLRGRLGIIVPIAQAIPGAILVYFVFFSPAPSTGWNWLLVPFNPVPLLLWPLVKRRMVSRALGGVLIAWVVLMLVWSHSLTHPTYLVLGAAFAIFYLLFVPRGLYRRAPKMIS